MNEDKREFSSSNQNDHLALDAADEVEQTNSSTDNILEHFPYLRNDGLWQMQAQQQGATGQFSDKIKAEPSEKVKTEHSDKVKTEPIDNISNNGHQTHSGNSEQTLTVAEEKKHSDLYVSSSNDKAISEGKHDYLESKSDNVGYSAKLGGTTKRDSVRVRPNVEFFLKGKLGHDMDAVIKSVQQIMLEPVDVEERFFEDFVYNYKFPEEIKKEPVDVEITGLTPSAFKDKPVLANKPTVSQNTQPSLLAHLKSVVLTNSPMKGITSPFTNTLTKSVTSSISKQTVRYTEPSIAEIRASVLGSSDPIQNFTGLNPGFDNTEKDEENNNTENDVVKEETLTDNENFESEINENKSNESWYNAAVKNYNTDTRKSEETHELTPSAKKGGRSDPENPFALTSPSFNDSTAKALMTTTQTSTATIVMISIMSIGSRAKLIPKIVNSKAAEGGLISVLNPIELPGNKSTQLDNEEQISSERTSIMSKLRREKSQSSEMNGASNSNIDRLDVNIKIDDNQYTGHGENKRWLCKICPKSYTTKHNLVAHILDHSDVKPHLCLVCEKYFKQLSHLNTHMLTHDNVKPYVCTICEKGFTQISHLKRHETVHMGSKPYICDVCNRGFAYPSELRLHKEKHVSGSEKCTDCDKEFSTWNELHEHMLSSSHCSDLQCKHCDRIFRFPSQLRDHMLSHAGSRPFICTECGMDFMKEHHLKSHLFTHTGLRPYACPECGRTFNQKANMQRHMLIHNAERAYKCEVCSKTFTQPQTLKAHMVVHSETKPYKCNICGKQFGRQHNLQGHMHIHSDTKPYSCSICQASFTLKGNLNRHKKVKHGLDESTEVMEEDAVNFLSTISDRTRETYFSVPSDNELDQDSRDSLSSPESKSSRKGRKSVPKKHVSRQPFNDTDGDRDSDVEQMITYSDEERENERTRESVSKYFEPSGGDNAGSRRKRKRGIVYRVDYDATDNNDESDGKEDNEETGSRESQNSENFDENKNAPSEIRSTRKRKKKDYGKDFTETGYDLETSSRSQKKKSAKLDNIIASKFSV